MRCQWMVLFLIIACSTYPDRARRQESQIDAGRVLPGPSTSPSQPEMMSPEQLAVYPGFRCFYYRAPEMEKLDITKPDFQVTFSAYYPIVAENDVSVILMVGALGEPKSLNRQALTTSGWVRKCPSTFLLLETLFQECKKLLQEKGVPTPPQFQLPEQPLGPKPA